MTGSITRLEDAQGVDDAPEAHSVERGRPAPCSHLVTGDLIGDKYRFETPLAEGGMGVVLRATHVELGCPVAIKVIRPEHASNEEVVARLLAEARIAASLRSKHVNRVLDVGRFESGTPYLVLEYLEGSDLGEKLNVVGHFSPTQAADYVLQACEGLAEAHAIGIVHRDIKPENLFVSEEPDGERVLKILDFGISRAPRSHGSPTLTKPWHVVGSPSYMAPEQMQGAEIDGRTDIWALGVVLYELCTGQLPFDAPSLREIFMRVLREEPLPPSFFVKGIDHAFECLIFKCLRKEPDERYASVVELAEALRPFASDPGRVARVRKVAASTIVRLERGRASEPGMGSLSPTTPLTLAASRLASIQLDPPPRRRRAAFFLGLAVAASIAFGAGLSVVSGLAAPRTAALAPAPPVKARPAPPPPSEPVVSDVEPIAAAAAPPPAAVTRPVVVKQPAPVTRPVTVTRPAAVTPLVVSQPAPVEPAPSAIEAVRPAPVTVPVGLGSSRAAPNAWDRQSFGGRR